MSGGRRNNLNKKNAGGDEVCRNNGRNHGTMECQRRKVSEKLLRADPCKSPSLSTPDRQHHDSRRGNRPDKDHVHCRHGHLSISGKVNQINQLIANSTTYPSQTQ